ncbi:MAG: hypothetical protein ABSD71_01450 [Bacteroidales bacterium]
MKKLMIFSLLIVTIFSGCKTQQKATGYTYDDVYSNQSNSSKDASKSKIKSNDLAASTQVVVADSSAKKAKVASSVDYSSNSYATKIKMSNGNNAGQNYTTSSDSTTSSGGSSPNVNLYLGDSWGSPFWSPYYSFGLGFGWGDFGFGWGYPYYYSPYSFYWDYPYWGYSNWGYPYWGGGWHHHHYWDWNNGNFYGQRTFASPNVGRNQRTASNFNATALSPAKNTRTINPRNVSNSVDQTRSGRSVITPVPPDKQRYSYSRNTAQDNARIRTTQINNSGSTRTYVQRREPTPRYSRPVAQEQMTRSNTQAYSSPAYRQPKSSQEYINPRPQQSRTTTANENSNRNTSYSNQGAYSRRYSSPSNNGGNSRVYSNPAGNSRFYSTPSRSYSSPMHSSPSRSFGSGYSAPSRSYSAPSHSGGGRSSGGGGHR